MIHRLQTANVGNFYQARRIECYYYFFATCSKKRNFSKPRWRVRPPWPPVATALNLPSDKTFSTETKICIWFSISLNELNSYVGVFLWVKTFFRYFCEMFLAVWLRQNFIVYVIINLQSFNPVHSCIPINLLFGLLIAWLIFLC